MTGLQPSNQPTAGNAPGGRYLPTLDGWRAIAVLLVVVYHARPAMIAAELLTVGSWPELATRHGFLGVDIFFAISGLLICSRLLDEQADKGRISLRAFYVRRAFRILPLYFSFLLLLGLCCLGGKPVASAKELVWCALFARNYLPPGTAGAATAGWYTGHFWSLAVEEHFYLFWPAVLIWLGRRRALWAAIALGLLVAAWRAIDARYHFGVAVGLDLGLADKRTDVRLDGLMWGCVAAFLFTSARARAFLEKWLTPWVLIAAAALFVATQRSADDVYAGFPGVVLLPLLLLGTIFNARRWFGRILEWRLPRWIGHLSYSIYVWQQLFLIAPWSYRLIGGIWVHFPMKLLGILLAATGSYYLIEKPMLRLGRLYLRRPRTPVAEPDLAATG